jgi:hypothetical protein
MKSATPVDTSEQGMNGNVLIPKTFFTVRRASVGEPGQAARY